MTSSSTKLAGALTPALIVRTASLILLLLASAQIVAAQGTTPPSIPPGAQELAAGWAAIAAGRAAEAERAGDALLRQSPRNHDALALSMAARLARRNVPGALDAYEAWLRVVDQREDVFLLETVALTTVDGLISSADRGVRTRALEIKAEMGDANAVGELRAAGGDGSSEMQRDAALARLQDGAAIQRLTKKLLDPNARDVSDAIDALREADIKTAAGPIAAALDPQRPLPTRMAAARALGQLGGADSIPALKEALRDPDPPVRIIAAVALVTLGDPSGEDIVRTLQNNPVGDYRLLAVEAAAAKDPNGAWVGVAKGVLQDPDPLVRLRAAELLLVHADAPGSAASVFTEALTDSNPALRHAAATRLDRLPPRALERELPTLRRLLRDPSPLSQLESAAGILRIAGALRR